MFAYTAAWLAAGDRSRRRQPARQRRGSCSRSGTSFTRRLPDAQLWLVGGARPEVVRRAAGRNDIVLFGRVPRERVLPILMNADLALYTRRAAAGLAVMKVSDYLAAGLPVVAFDELRVAAQLASTGAAVVVPDDPVLRRGRGAARA